MKWNFSDPTELVRLMWTDGSAFIDDRRILLLDAEALRQLRRSLAASQGMMSAGRLLSNWGYANGFQDAIALKRSFARKSKLEWFRAGTEVLALRGFASVDIVSGTLDETGGDALLSVEWRNPWEVDCAGGTQSEEILRTCSTINGYLGGFAAAVTGGNVFFLEIACCSRGDEICRAKARSEWAEDDEEVIALGRMAEEFTSEKVSLNELIEQNAPNTERIRKLITELEAQRAQIESLQNQVQYLQEIGSEEKPVRELIGTSAVYKKALRAAQKVAPTDSTVLIQGETGTGKELFARYIHTNSLLKNRPLITVNCAALPPSLIESELFGHEKGAFTGAVQRKLGRFEIANGATIFLDEVGELPLETQAKFLRALQEGEIERVGGTQTIPVKVRVLAATNRDLEAAIEEGTFRADLFYRLNVFPIHIPPLRARGNDLVQLVSYFAEKFRRQFHKPITSISQSSIDALRAYPFPGNVRELQHLIERSVLLSEGTVLEIDPPVSRTTADVPDTEAGEIIALDEMERRYIRSVLRHTGGAIAGKGGAAELLELPPSTLRSRIKKLGIG